MVKVNPIMALPIVVHCAGQGEIKKLIRFSILKANASTDNKGSI